MSAPAVLLSLALACAPDPEQLPPLVPAGPPFVLNPRTYRSPSGRCELFVDPSERRGAGPGVHRLTRDGELVWEAELELTLCNAVVSDEGRVAGYAYTAGGGHYRGRGEFVIVILDEAGELLFEERTAPTPVGEPDPVYHPRASGLIHDADRGRFTVRFETEDFRWRAERWRTYSFDDGRRLSELRLREHVAPTRNQQWKLLQARAVPGTELVLLHWQDYRMGSYGRGASALFQLLEDDGDLAWTHRFPFDYGTDRDYAKLRRLEDYVARGGGIAALAGDGSFSLRCVADRERVDFRATRSGEDATWQVEELGRAPLTDLPELVVKPAAIPELVLEQSGAFTLDAGQEEVEARRLRDLENYAIAGDGTLRVIRREKDGSHTALVVNVGGEVLRERSLEPCAPGVDRHWIRWLFLEPDLWLCLQQPVVNDNRLDVWRVRTDSGEAEHVDVVFCPSCGFEGAFAPDGEGGFVALGKYDSGGPGRPTLYAFDSEGKRRWSGGGDRSGLGDSKNPAQLFSPNDLAVVDQRWIVVVDCIAHRLQVFDLSGNFIRAIDLEQAFGQEPSYPSEVVPDVGGGVVVEDFDGSPSHWRLKLDGEVVGRFTPRYPDGRELRDVRVAPDGTLWATDGQLLFRLDEDGVVREILGEEPPREVLNQCGATALDREGRVCIQDERTGAVHVFATDGRRVLVTEARPSDEQYAMSWGRLTCSPDGRIFAEASIDHDTDDPYDEFLASLRQFLAFDENGERLGLIDLRVEAACFQPTSARLWGVRENELLLVDESGAELLAVARRPGDRHWLREPRSPTVLPDGGVVALSFPREGHDAPPQVLVVYGPEGRPRQTIPLPLEIHASRLSANAEWVALHSWAPEFHLLRLADQALYGVRLEPPVEPRGSWTPLFPPSGEELWFFSSADLSVRRYRLPE